MLKNCKSTVAKLTNVRLWLTSAAAGVITLSPTIIQDGDNPFGWLGEFFSNIGEFFSVVAQNIFSDVPTTPLEIIDVLFGNALTAKLDQMYQNLLVLPRLEDTIFYWVVVAAGAVGFLVVAIKAVSYFFKLFYYMSPPRNYTPEQVIRGNSPLISPISYWCWQLPITIFVVLMSPALFAEAYFSLREVVKQTVLAVYGTQTIGGVTYNLIVGMLEGQGLVWFVVTFVLFLLLFAVFLIIYAVVNLAVIATAAWTTIQVARYGDGKTTFVVITDAALTNLKAWVVLLIMLAELFGGPAVLSEASFSWFPTALALVVWLGVMIASPFIIVWAWPKAERIIVTKVKDASIIAREFISPEGRYYPKQRFLDLSEDRYAQETESLGIRETAKQAASRIQQLHDAYQRLSTN